MWKLIFNESTNIGTGCNREPGVGEFSRDLAPAQCAWFNVTPGRYLWNGYTIVERPEWEGEEAAKAELEAKRKVEAGIRAAGSSQLLALGNPYSKEERETWITQEAEARAWTSDNLAPCPMITAMAITRSIPLALMAQKIIENADLFKVVAGQILGAQQKELDLLG